MKSENPENRGSLNLTQWPHQGGFSKTGAHACVLKALKIYPLANRSAHRENIFLAFDRDKENLALRGSAKCANIKIRKIDDDYQNTEIRAVVHFSASKSGLIIERHLFIYDDGTCDKAL